MVRTQEETNRSKGQKRGPSTGYVDMGNTEEGKGVYRLIVKNPVSSITKVG